MVKVGAVLIVGSILALLGYAAYYLVQAFFASGVSLVLRLALPAALLGLTLLVVAVVRDRMREHKGEHFEGVDH